MKDTATVRTRRKRRQKLEKDIRSKNLSKINEAKKKLEYHKDNSGNVIKIYDPVNRVYLPIK